jgi:hypothetical protein
MRIIFDQATPVPIRPYLECHVDRSGSGRVRPIADNRQEHALSAESGGRKITIVVLGQQQWPQLRPPYQKGVTAGLVAKHPHRRRTTSLAARTASRFVRRQGRGPVDLCLETLPAHRLFDDIHLAAQNARQVSFEFRSGG